MTTDVGEAKQLLTAAQQAGTIFMVGHRPGPHGLEVRMLRVDGPCRGDGLRGAGEQHRELAAELQAGLRTNEGRRGGGHSSQALDPRPSYPQSRSHTHR